MGEEVALPTSSSGGDLVLPFATWARVHALARHGRSVRGIGRDLALDRKTVRRALRQTQPEPYHRALRLSLLAPYDAYLRVRAPEIDYNAWRLFQELEAQGYRQTHVPVGRESAILTWITQEPCRKGCVVVTSPSCALRLALVAKRTDMDLSNVTFLTTSEPLTPAKLAAIHAVGARAFSRFSFAELGAAAAHGCASPASPDDMHVCRDRVAVIQRRRPADEIGSEVNALLFTYLRSDGERILLNMETGDYARMTTRPCGCLLETVGWTDHLEGVRSFEKLTPEGGSFLGSNLISLIEEILPAQFGGDLTDYQLLEQEDHDGFTRLIILVHPRLGTIDEEAIRDCAERTLEATNWVIARICKEAGTFRVLRDAPLMTRVGKVMPLHRLSLDQALGGYRKDVQV